MNIQHTWVSPAQATEWLQKNATNNRRPSNRRIAQYSRDMLSGNWRATGESIKFDRSGRLIDGQHRLRAIEKAGIQVEMVIITGLEEDTIQVIDTGKSRSSGDALLISGTGTNANAIAALTRKIIAYQNGYGDILSPKNNKVKGISITNREVIEYNRDNDLTPHVHFATLMNYQQVAKVYTSGEWAFIHWLLSSIDTDKADHFLRRLATLENMPASSTIRTLFDKLTKSTVDLNAKQRLQATIIAWNAWRKDQVLLRIQVSNIEGDIVPV